MSNDLFSWNDTPETTFTNDPLAKYPYAECSTCPLLAYPCVSSFKPQDTISLIVVGDYPTFYDVQYNEVLNAQKVDQPGALLNAVLENTGFDPKTVYRTNAIMCQAPKNIDTKQAVESCSKRLEAELAIIECDMIVALGNSAVQSLDMLSGKIIKDSGILSRRGQWYDWLLPAHGALENNGTVGTLHHEKWYLATLHPAFVLRSTGYMSQFLADMRSINLTPSTDWHKITYTVVDPTNTTYNAFINRLGEWCATDRMIAFDVETHNLDPKSPLLELGVTVDQDHAWIIPGKLIREDQGFRDIIDAYMQLATLVAHNGKFDQQVLARNGIAQFNLTDDTLLMHYMLDEQKGTHDLKQVASSFLGVHDYESELVDTYFRNMKRSERDYSLIPEDKRHEYLAIDCCATLALQKLFDPMIDADNVRHAYQLRINASNALQYTEAWGIKIDVPYLTVVHQKLTEAIENAEHEIQATASEHAMQYLQIMNFNTRKLPSWIKTEDQYLKIFNKIIHGDKKNIGINLSSWQQVQVLLYDVLGLKHIKGLGYKTDPRSTNAEALDALEPHPFVTILQEYRRLDKIRGTYVEKLLTLADDNDRVHVRYNIHGTETGRLSANDGLHGIPRANRDQWGAAIRGAFIAQEGYKIGKCDYAQAELRVFAALSNETFLLDMFRNGDDPHGNITLMVFGDDPRFTGMSKESYNKTTEEWELPQVDGYSKEDQKRYWKEKRTTGKNVVFGGLVYQGKAPGIVAMIRAQTGKDVDIKIVDHVLNSMLDQMPNAKQWQMDQFRHARDNGYVQTRLGMKRRFMLITEDNLEDVKKASVNAPIQGVVAELLMLAATQLIQQGIRVLLLNHDEIVFEAKDTVITTTAQLVKQTMIDVAAQYFPECAWNAEYSIGNAWYEPRPIII